MSERTFECAADDCDDLITEEDNVIAEFGDGHELYHVECYVNEQ